MVGCSAVRSARWESLWEPTPLRAVRRCRSLEGRLPAWRAALSAARSSPLPGAAVRRTPLLCSPRLTGASGPPAGTPPQ